MWLCRRIAGSPTTPTTTMATGSSSNDSTNICKMCQDPHSHRSLRTLPCFHKFCLPCLTVLEKGSKITLEARSKEDGKEERKFIRTFSCPICKTVIPVPADGVAKFQANFNLTCEPHTCKVCDQSQKAVYMCSDCCRTMCAQCQRCHEIFTSNHRIGPLTSSGTQSSQNTSLPPFVETITDDLAVLEAALVTMREEEDTLQRETQAVADVISRRADALRALVTQAERNSQRALAELSMKLSKQLQEEIVSAREKQSVIMQLCEHGSAERQNLFSSNDLRRFLLRKKDSQHYRQRNKSKRPKFLIPIFDDLVIDEEAISSFIGVVFDSTQVLGETNDCDTTGESETTSEMKGDMNKRTLGLEEVASEITSVKSQLKRLQTVVNSLCNKQKDNTQNEFLQKELDELKVRFYMIEESMMRTNPSSITENFEVLKKKLLIIDKKILGIQLEVQNLYSDPQKASDRNYPETKE